MDGTSMNPALHVVAWRGPGRLAMMGHPRAGCSVADEMAALARVGVDVLVSALTDEERRRLGAQDAASAAVAAAAAGVEYVSFPIPDRGVPDPEATLELSIRLAAHVRAGRFVVTQCFAAIGRSTVLAGATLIVLGVEAGEALAMMSAARGLPVPDTAHQHRWLAEFAELLQP
jgi:protein-tyrosine phosphatase